MGKLCSLSRHTTFLLSGIADLQGKVVKNASQCANPLFMGVEFSAKFLCNLCSICWSNHPRAFVGMAEGKLLSNFCIQVFVHFCCKHWRKIESNRATLNCFWAERARAWRRAATCHICLAAVSPGAHTGAGPWPLVQGRAPRALCAYGAWHTAHH
jgi:hypothetical protein